MASRELYSWACDPEGAPAGGLLVEQIREQLRRSRSEPAEASSVSAWAAVERRRFAQLWEAADEEGRAVLARRAALGAAPLALVSGAWLQWLSAPANADDPAVLRILSVYAADVGVGHPGASRGAAFLAVLRALRLSRNAVPAGLLVLDQRVAEGAFELPAVLLAMSRRPQEFRPQIVGADWCLRAVGLLPALALVREQLPSAPWEAVDASAWCEQARAAAEGLGPAQAEGVEEGFRWAFCAVRRWSEALWQELEACRGPAFEMAELMRQRAREGSVYHHDFLLAGRPLSQWLKECRTDPGPLLSVLADSRLIKPGRSAASALVNGLVGERGPMFRVFSPQDLEVIRRWIDSLPPRGTPTPDADTGADADGGAASQQAAGAAGAGVVFAVPSGEGAGGEADREPQGLREAYHRLQTRDDSPALRRFAQGYVRGWLARSRHGGGGQEMRLPRAWGPEGLRPWLAEQHDRHGQEFERSADAPVASREALIDSTVQLAPLTLIDGGWLQGFTDYAHASSEVGFSLFETYWDELGNGEARLNHPLIYRQVLAEMDVSLPPTGSAQFAHWPGFKDASFELPVYWLSLGRFPRTFLPEVLGLNLAMELSGVGGSYRRARIALKEHGFSTRFVDIHNTIDNVATGHSAWAADAVDAYLAALPATGARAAAWERVRTGYGSLNPPSGFFARRAERRGRRPRARRV